jgi:hypothetical protein
MVSLFGIKIFDLSLDDVEKILRKVYKEITFVKFGKIYLKQIIDISPISGIEDLKFLRSERAQATQPDLFDGLRKLKTPYNRIPKHRSKIKSFVKSIKDR